MPTFRFKRPKEYPHEESEGGGAAVEEKRLSDFEAVKIQSLDQPVSPV